MNFRERVARWLSPSLARRADRYWWLASEIELCARWLAEFKDVSKTLQHLQESDHDYWREAGSPRIGVMPHDISEFRDLLRRETRDLQKSA